MRSRIAITRSPKAAGLSVEGDSIIDQVFISRRRPRLRVHHMLGAVAGVLAHPLEQGRHGPDRALGPVQEPAALVQQRRVDSLCEIAAHRGGTDVFHRGVDVARILHHAGADDPRDLFVARGLPNVDPFTRHLLAPISDLLAEKNTVPMGAKLRLT
jgi:hypothetical protein